MKGYINASMYTVSDFASFSIQYLTNDMFLIKCPGTYLYTYIFSQLKSEYLAYINA